ncbi:MAG TPA: hypothetical protein VEL05_10610, partial [Candidatus Acidoferrum sp.]|nr:hypothetical protein [Candidatus Acidoferrum sp.]
MLLEVMRRRARARTPADVFAQYQRDRFTGPSPLDQRVAVEIDRHLFAAASGFEALELSPVAPLGACSTVAMTGALRTLPVGITPARASAGTARILYCASGSAPHTGAAAGGIIGQRNAGTRCRCRR